MDEDTPLTLRLRAGALDDLPLGVLRLGLDGRIRYVNRAAARLAGPEMQPGATLRAMPFEAESVARLDDEIRRRHRAQRASAYPLALNRPDRGPGVRVHLQVVGLPEYDAEGRLAGSLGFIEDRTLELAALAIHEAIGAADDCEQLLDSLAGQLDEVMHFDAMLVSMISEDRSAVRLLHSRPAMAVSHAWGWWPMPEMVRADLDELDGTRVDTVAELFAREPYAGLARHDVATRDFIDAGWRHMLRRPVFRDGALAAILTLLRREDRPFDDDDAERATQLPIVEAVNVALALDRQRALEFELELIGSMGQAAGNLSDVACVLVDGLRRTRGWDHVSLFRVDHDERVASLVHQSAAPGSELPDGYRQALASGVLGEVALSGRALRLGDVRTSACYTAGVAGTVSEMCLPVPGQPVRWLLNLESSKSNAFAAAEQASIERTLKVAGLILDRSWALEFNTALLDAVADAVIQTTARGEIQAVNPACEALTGLPREALLGRQFAELLSAPGHEADPPGYAERLVEMPRLLSSEVELRARDGTQVPVLLSGASLPPQIGGKVYVASDLRFRREAQRMDSLRHVYSQVANEIRVPLSLASTYLRGHTGGGDNGTDVLDKALRQLLRADLSLERVARLASTPEDGELPLRVVSLDQLAAQLHDDLPRRQQKTVDLLPDPLAPPVLAAPPELAFCASSLLAFLLRMRAQDDRIRIRVDGGHALPRLCFELADERGDPSPTRLEPRSDEEREFALAEGVLRTLMRRMRGQLVVQQHLGLSLALRLSAAEGG
ncbi:PAS domain S-box protein [Rubrivivax gelatinosus]|uniref:PAS domain S-box protein n=1 Tax=Rubrivivax gelatinosus TaxID=28068 RepID=UPI0002FE4F53|nr:PAS domain S-box protein [Rubrivivax gelatinosus]MBG6082758.1 PAS domain S-box-containing protein [Rubrivivax gelatinosus]